MSACSEEPDHTIELEAAHAILDRAAELDSLTEHAFQVSHLREAALEAGIGVAAFEQALSDHSATVRQRAPLWVRICLSGVPSRRAAMVFYYGFLTSAVAVAAASIFGRLPVVPAVAVGVFLTFAVWSTGEAVRWQDRECWGTRK